MTALSCGETCPGTGQRQRHKHLLLSGHHHRYIFREKGSCGNNFPIVANSNVERLDFRADSDKITLSIYDESGKLTRSLEVVR